MSATFADEVLRGMLRRDAADLLAVPDPDRARLELVLALIVTGCAPTPAFVGTTDASAAADTSWRSAYTDRMLRTPMRITAHSSTRVVTNPRAARWLYRLAIV